MFAEDERFSIDALIARYENEPTLREIFVEGRSEREVFEAFVEKRPARVLSVFSIDDVNVPRDIVEARFGSGNRGRVVALAHQLSASLIATARAPYCIADKDLNTVLDSDIDCGRLWFSDYACLESYLFDSDNFRRIIRSFFGIEFSEDEYDALVAACNQLYLVRAARTVLEPKLALVDIRGSLNIRDGEIYFDLQDYLNRFLVSRRRDMLTPFNEAIVELSRREADDPRNRIHKDDLAVIACWLGESKKVIKDLRQPMVLLRVVLSHLREADLSCYPLFTRLTEWLARDCAA
jgi:hypothetical protein